MEVKEFELKILEKIQETPTVFSLKLEQDKFEYLAGHYVGIDLRSNPSEYQMMKAFSLASSPTEDSVLLTYNIGDSPFKQRLNSLNVGDRIKIKGPYGRFLFQEDLSKKAVMIAGGIGITPFRGMIRYVWDKKLPVQIDLIYSNRTPDEIAFYNELENIKKNYSNIHIVYTVTKEDSDWKGNVGRISEDLIKNNISEINNSVFYICGSPSMVEDMLSLLRKIGIKEENLKYEKFTGYK